MLNGIVYKKIRSEFRMWFTLRYNVQETLERIVSKIKCLRCADVKGPTRSDPSATWVIAVLNSEEHNESWVNAEAQLVQTHYAMYNPWKYITMQTLTLIPN